MCQSSCARMAFIWASVRQSEIPLGHNNTGRAMPKIPGSRVVRDNRSSSGSWIPTIRSNWRIASASRPAVIGAAWRIIAEIRRQRRYHPKRTTKNPQSQGATRIIGRIWRRLAVAVAEVGRGIIDIVVWSKGWLTSCIATYKLALVGAEERNHDRWLPRKTSRAKGMRNFSEAANQRT